MANSPSPSEIFYEILDQFRWRWRSWDELKATSWFTKVNYTNFFLFILFVIVAIYQARSKTKGARDQGPNKAWLPAPEFPDIKDLPDFSWKDEEPLKLRPFKSKYYLTMALQKLDPSEYLLMDKNYAERIEYRKKAMKEHHDIVITLDNEARVAGAVRELYTWIMATYLPKRYPTMFKLHHATFETGSMYMLENLVTKALLPAQATKVSNTIGLLENLVKTVDEDFLFLVPEDVAEGKEDETKYVLEACICVCPSGWHPQQKIGKRLGDVHGPVPRYRQYLEGSMDRHFRKIKVGEYEKRANWMISTNGELLSYQDDSNHAHEGDVIEPIKNMDPTKVSKNDMDKYLTKISPLTVNWQTFLRCERQTLHRLPKSNMIVFAFKTYMYSIKEVKEEGQGEELAQAIDGMKEGNAPEMHFYKRGPAWGEAVKAYLRS